MRKGTKILYVYPPGNEFCRMIVHALRDSLHDWDIAVSKASLTTLLFDIRRFDLTHFFLPATAKSAQLVRKMGPKTRLVQTVVAPPNKPEDYRNAIFGHQVVVFSHLEKATIEKHAPTTSVTVIPPCIALPNAGSLLPAGQLREKYGVGDRMLVVALSDLSTKQEFDSFLYIAREYNRREVFRLLIPNFKKNKNAALWRGRLHDSISLEKLDCVTLLEESVDLHSLIDGADIVLYLDRDRDSEFDYPLKALEALCLGKPVLCFGASPLSELVHEFHPQWVVNNTEDVVRETRDIKKEEAKLEQISTELARFTRSRVAADKIASLYRELYERLLAETVGAKI